MRLLERNPRLSGLVVGLAVLALAGVRAEAQLKVSSTDPGSIVVFPKVIADGTRDTIIALTNTSNMMAYVHCEATNGIGRCSGSPDPENQIYYCNADEDCLDVTDPAGNPIENVGPCERVCQPEDFEFALTIQQPTFWRVSTGRVQDPNLASGNSCSPVGNSQSCPGFFLSPADNQGAGANVPGQDAFRGEIRCFQVGVDGGLTAGDALKGEAFIEQLGPTGEGAGVLSAYNSINIEGGEEPADPTTANLDGVEYAQCPEALTFDVLAPEQADPISGASVDVEFTFVPCTYNTVNPTWFRIAFDTYDELETAISGGDIRSCWANYTGSLTGGVMDRDSLYLRATAGASQTGNCTAGSAVGFGCTSDSDCGRQGVCFDNECVSGTSTGRTCADATDCGANGVCGPPSNVLGVAETFYTGGGVPGTSAEVAHHLAEGASNDVMSFTGGF